MSRHGLRRDAYECEGVTDAPVVMAGHGLDGSGGDHTGLGIADAPQGEPGPPAGATACQ